MTDPDATRDPLRALAETDRERLQALAYGTGSDPSVADAARRELARRDGDRPAVVVATGTAATETVSTDTTTSDSTLPDGAPTDTPPPRRRPSLRLVALVAATAVVAAGLGVGGTVLASRIGPTVVSDGRQAGQGVRIAATLAADRDGDDRLPSTMIADVDRSTTHIVYETYPGQPPIRWRVWLATSQDGSEVCFVVSADDTASDVTCTARTEALDGVVRYVTRDDGEGLSLLDEHGTVGIELVGVD